MSKIKEVKIFAKCADMCGIQLLGQDGETLHEGSGYVPPFVPNEFGDYVDITVDPKTGKILNWVPVSEAEMIKQVGGMDS